MNDWRVWGHVAEGPGKVRAFLSVCCLEGVGEMGIRPPSLLVLFS